MMDTVQSMNPITRWLGLLGTVFASACGTATRLPAPPNTISAAAPVGYSSNVRLVTMDRRQFVGRSQAFFQDIKNAALDGTVDVLALSGGGSGGAFGAGILVGLSRTHRRPQFELVTGVSAGALIAPFAFLGSEWDAQLEEAFLGERSQRLMRTPALSIITRLAFPKGFGANGPLFDLVDHYITPQLVAAVASASGRGRKLIIATTDLDKQETVLWNMGEIASGRNEAAREQFRDVLIASASVPGIFPPVLMHVTDSGHRFDELHVDGGVTTPLFVIPLIASIQDDSLAPLEGANLFIIVNGQLATAPMTTPFDTVSVLARSFSAELTYKTREAVSSAISFARNHHMRFRMTDIPIDYPVHSFIDFEPKHMRTLFEFANHCAASGHIWVTALQSIERNLGPVLPTADSSPECPAASAES